MGTDGAEIEFNNKMFLAAPARGNGATAEILELLARRAGVRYGERMSGFV